jgi:glycine/D-amino acid oxidase-like deaminating enzyme
MGPDCTIFGAGIVGAACAYYLAQDGLKVEVVDPRPPALGATSAGMGHLVAMDDSEAQLALTAYSLRLWRDLIPCLDCEYEPCGTIWIASDDDELAVCQAKKDFYAQLGVESEVWDQRRLYQAEPYLRDGLSGGLYVPGDSVIYAPAACRQLLKRSGAALVSQPTGEAPIRVCAAGVASPEFISNLPMRPRKGHLAITERYPGLITHQLVELGYLRSAHGSEASSVAFNLQPRATGQVLVGSSREFDGLEPAIRTEILSEMLSRATSMVPALSGAKILRSWTGFRPATPDHLPLIGRHTGGMWVATGHEGLGITTALATGKILADLIAARAPEINHLPFDPNRTFCHG